MLRKKVDLKKQPTNKRRESKAHEIRPPAYTRFVCISVAQAAKRLGKGKAVLVRVGRRLIRVVRSSREQRNLRRVRYLWIKKVKKLKEILKRLFHGN